MDVKHVGLECLGRISLGEDSDKLRTVINKLIGLWVLFVA